MKVAVQNPNFKLKNKSAVRLVPPWFIEGGFYASVFYGIVVGPVFGFNIERLGIIFLAVLAFFCFLGYRERAIDFFKMLVFPICLGVSYILIQYMYHGLSIDHDYVKPFVPWIFTIIVVQALSFRRGFLHRYAIFALLVGVIVLPFLDFRAYGDNMTRVALEKGMGLLSNANGLAEWFGFIAVYFFIFGVVSQRHKTRLASWIIATGCLFIVMLTVSRGALLAVAFAIILAGREFLRRGFFPIILLIMLVAMAYSTGIFDQTISFYTMRATEESGRFFIWPRAFERFMNAPWTGVGGSNMLIFIPEMSKKATAHNSFLFFAMASGIVPLIFYAAYWIQAAWTAFRAPIRRAENAPFFLPLVTYAFLVSLSGSTTFMSPYVLVTIAVTMASSVLTPLIPSKAILRK